MVYFDICHKFDTNHLSKDGDKKCKVNEGVSKKMVKS
jgi:hypothetical protein